MFFTTCGRVIAVLAILIGVYGVAVGFWLATGEGVASEADVARYLPSSQTTGEAIDRGIYRILFGIVLGILTEISFTLRRANNPTAKPNPRQTI